MGKIYFIISLIIILSGTNIVSGQECYKKKLCQKSELKDYDYRSQSSYQTLTTGDTLNIKVVAYNKQAFHLLACSDPKLGQLQIKVIYPEKTVQRYIKQINQNNENPALNDTLWSNRVVTEYETIFDNSDDKSIKSWEFSSRKTRLLIINITAPEGKENYTGCANILLGHKILTTERRNLR